jgi:hypothetical protein
LWTPAKTGRPTCSSLLLPLVENPRGMAGLAKQKFAGSYREFDTEPTDSECPHRQRSSYCHLCHAPC